MQLHEDSENRNKFAFIFSIIKIFSESIEAEISSQGHKISFRERDEYLQDLELKDMEFPTFPPCSSSSLVPASFTGQMKTS